MDGDEARGGGKKTSFETSGEMLAKYQAELNSIAQDANTSQPGDPSDEELLHNNTTGRSIEPPGTSMTEGLSSRDITQSSMSVSEGEGDGDLEGMAGRVAELEEMLQGKEAVVEALSAEIDHLRAEASSPNSSQSHNSSTHQYRDVLLVYHTKLQDFERAVNQRDNLIHDLTASLEQALSARDALKAQLQSMSNDDLTSTNMGHCISMQDRIGSLEVSLDEHKTMISQLNAELLKSYENSRKLEMEKEAQSAEIDDYKTRVNQLNEKIRVGAVENTLNIAETMEMQKQYEARVDKIKKDMQIILEKFNAETRTKSAQHEEATRELESKYKRELASTREKYEEQYRDLADRYNRELPDLESKHAKELSVFQAQLSAYKKSVESLKTELANRSECQQSLVSEINSLRDKFIHSQKDKDMLTEQIKLHKVQLEDLTSKYVAAASILDSKESIERSLEEALTNVAALKLENEALKFKYDDLSARYSAAQSLIESNQAHERSMSHRIFDLEKSLSRLSGMSISVTSEFNETTYQTFDDAAIKFHATHRNLDERTELEKQLVDKIRSLEHDVAMANDRLNRANLEKESYEKQLKDMKNTCDKMRIEQNSLIRPTNCQDSKIFRSSDYFGNESSTKSSNAKDSSNDVNAGAECQEISRLREILEVKNHENTEMAKKIDQLEERLVKSEAECQHLKNGVAIAWEQCAEFEERLNQTLAMNETRFTDSIVERDSNPAKYSENTFANVKVTDTQDKSIQTDSDIEVHDYSKKSTSQKSPIAEIDCSKNLSSNFMKFDDIAKQLETFKLENHELRLRNDKLIEDLETMDRLRENIARFEAEKKSYDREIANLADKHREELAAVREESTMEIEKIRNLMLTVGQGDTDVEELKTELNNRHAREMEELRTYFEEKCLQMEKQYSDEIFSQQSKKMSDNDSDIDDLAEDLYFGGGGDCSNTNPINADNSRGDINHRRMDEKIYNNENHPLADSGLVNAVNQLCQTECDSTLENGELTKLRAAYSNQLEEQVALAKLDILNALQEQIQALIAVDTDTEENWPTELLQLRNKFTNNAKRETEELKLIHASELKQLRDEHCRSVARIIERHQEEMRNIMDERGGNDGEIVSQDSQTSVEKNELVRERDNLYKTCLTLKNFILDLTKYFAVCEEELNNTLISEVLKRQTLSEADSSEKTSEHVLPNKMSEETRDFELSVKSPITKIKRVHFAPQCSQIVSLINGDDETSKYVEDRDGNLAEIFRRQLDDCLERMKFESAQVLGMNSIPGENILDILTKQALWTTKINEELNEKLSQAERRIIAYAEETKILKSKVAHLQRDLFSIDEKKEIVSEGYGEHEESGGELAIQDFSQLQEKARHAIVSGIGENAYLLQLIEELCRYNDRMTDETRKEKEDLQQQIEAADKQLRATRKFLEEQASEREIERDDAARQINALQEQMKERERDKERDLRITSESSLSPVSSTVVRVLESTDINAAVEALETQMREMSSLMSETETKKAETESELKVAVDKIWVLRDIIVDLEHQIQARIEKEETLVGQIEQLEEVIAAQTKNQHELAQELDSIKMGGENSQLNEHINQLEEQLRKHKLSSEHFDVNSSALKQMRIELREMENQLDKRTKELEVLHVCGSNLSLSQPSEDVSIREQIDVTRAQTPDDPNSPPVLPLDQLLKLKEKMLKHARAEEVAFKRIKDLDMQLSTYKIQNEELQAEQEILQQTASEQLFQMEAMRGRLEQHKQSAPFAQRQATSRLELQLHEANAKLHSLEETIGDKELEVNELKEQLQRANKLLQDKQKEFMTIVQTENNAIQELKDRLKILEGEKKLLESKVGVQERAQVELPQLIDSMLADKNEEIDHLKDQLSKRDKQLQLYLSATNIDENEFAKQMETKNSARTLSDILSINSECEDYSEAIRDATNLSQPLPHNISTFKIPLTTVLTTKETCETSPATLVDANKPMMKVPRLDLGSSNSQSLSTSCPRHSRPSLDLIQTMDFDSKSLISVENDESPLNNDKTIDKTDNNCSCDKEDRERRGKKSSKSISVITRDETLNLRIEELEKRLRIMEEELRSKCSSLEKRDMEIMGMEKMVDELRLELKESVDALTRDKEFYKNQYELSQASELKIRRDLEEIENRFKLQSSELEEYKNVTRANERVLIDLGAENNRLKQLAKRLADVEKSYDDKFADKNEESSDLRQMLFDKDAIIETAKTRNHELENENQQLHEYKSLYDRSMNQLESSNIEIKRLTETLDNRDRVIKRLEDMARRTSVVSCSSSTGDKDHEIHHLQEYLKEKEKVIRQMSDDSKSLQRALETIQNKMKESGNVVELRKKLKDERIFNAELKNMVEKLKQELEGLKDESMRQSIEGADIEDMVQRELDLSARLDQQIMEVIESESEENKPRKIEKHSCNSLTIKPSDDDRTERVAQKYTEIRQRYKQALKMNEELSKQRDDNEIERDILNAQMNEYEKRIYELTKNVDEKCRRMKDLEDENNGVKSRLRTLEIESQRDKISSENAHGRDSELISQLRIKLVASMDNEERARNELTQLRSEMKNFQRSLNSAKDNIESRKFAQNNNAASAKLLIIEDEKLQSHSEIGDREKRRNTELREIIERIEAEKNRFEKELECANDEHEKLASSLALAESAKDHLAIDLKRTKEELGRREEECDWLKKRIKTLSDALAKRQQQNSHEQNEVKQLKRGINNAREVMIDLEADLKQSKIQLAKAVEEKERLAQALEVTTSNGNELVKKLDCAKSEENRLRETIDELKNELQTSVKREMELIEDWQKERFAGDKNVPAKFVQKIKELNEAVEKHSHDNSVLHEKLSKARQEREQFSYRVKELEAQLAQKIREANNGAATENLTSQMTENLQYFYGKYLRVDSRRKALVYQKHYLLCIVGGYQLSEDRTLSILAQLTHEQRMHTTTSSNRKSPKVRFRCAALVIISIHRMKWMIHRWRTGRRIGANAVMGHHEHGFLPLRRTASNHSPPVRDRTVASGFSLERYLDRFMDIQQRLGLAIPNSET